MAFSTELNANPFLTATQRKEKKAARKTERLAKRDAKKQARADKKAERVAKREGRKADRQYKKEIRRTERLGIPFTGWDMPGAPSYHAQRYVPEGHEYRLGGGLKEMGWQHLLTRSEGPNKRAGSTRYEIGAEAYSTQETRSKSQSQGFTILNPHPNTPTLNPSYKQMFRQMLPKGEARKALRKYL